MYRIFTLTSWRASYTHEGKNSDSSQQFSYVIRNIADGQAILPVRLQEVHADCSCPDQREGAAVEWQNTQLMRTLRCSKPG